MTIAFTLPGQVPVYTFSLLVGVGASLGLFWAVQQAGDRERLPLMVVGIAGLLGAFIGARLGYALLNFGYFADRPLEIFRLPGGGLTWGGALLGALLAGWPAAIFQPISARRAIDLLFPTVTILSISLWLGCWLDGCAFGAASQAWYALPARDDWGNLVARYPLQLLGATLSLLTLLLYDRFRRILTYPGTAGGAGLAILALQTIWLSAQRADPVPLVQALRADLLAAYAFTAVAILLLLFSIAGGSRKGPAGP